MLSVPAGCFDRIYHLDRNPLYLKCFPSNDVYQSLVIDGLLSTSGLGVEAVAFGDMFCNGIADYRRSYIEPVGWQCVFSL